MAEPVVIIAFQVSLTIPNAFLATVLPREVFKLCATIPGNAHAFKTLLENVAINV